MLEFDQQNLFSCVTGGGAVVCVWHANRQQRHGRLLAVQLHSLQAMFSIAKCPHTLHAGPINMVRFKHYPSLAED